MTQYESAREQKIKVEGGILQRKGEEFLDKHDAQPFVETRNTITGNTQFHKRDVASALIKKHEVETAKKVFSVPALPWKNYD